MRRICRRLDPYLGDTDLHEIDGDVVWKVCQGELAKGNKPATVNRYLATIRSAPAHRARRMAVDRRFPKIRMLPGEVERDRWLTREEAERLDRAMPASHCGDHPVRAGDGLPGARDHRLGMGPGGSGSRDRLARPDQERNAARRTAERGCGGRAGSGTRQARALLLHLSWAADPMGLSNTAWLDAVRKAGLEDFRFHDTRHTWASWHRQAGTSAMS